VPEQTTSGVACQASSWGSLEAWPDRGDFLGELARREPIDWSLATFATNPDLKALDRALWQRRKFRVARLNARALLSLSRSRRRYWEARAGSAAKPVSERVERCGKEQLGTRACKKCGKADPLYSKCGLVECCSACSRKYYGKIRAKTVDGLNRWIKHLNGVENRVKTGFKRYSPILITLTIRHSGDLEKDRDAIRKAWPRFRAWLHHRTGAPPYVMVWECTEGTEKDGHVHAHLISLWPFISYDDCIAEWKALTRGDGSIHFERKSVSDGAKYAAKYVTKGVKGLNATLGAAWYASSWQRRRLSTSKALFSKESNETLCCKSKWVVELWLRVGTTEPIEREGPASYASPNGGQVNRGPPLHGFGNGMARGVGLLDGQREGVTTFPERMGWGDILEGTFR